MSAAPNTPAAAQSAKPSLPPTAFVAMGIGAIAVTVMILLLVYTPVVSFLFASAPPTVEPVSETTIRVREHEFTEHLASAGDKIVKRSPFHPPVAPEEPPPKVPQVYGGPTIVGVAGGAVYFAETGGTTKRINLGETADEVTVVKIDAPWSVTLGWKGGEFVVPMLDRQPVKFDSTLTVKDMLFQTTPAAAQQPSGGGSQPTSRPGGRPRRS